VNAYVETNCEKGEDFKHEIVAVVLEGVDI
jgi:hypothetical protein